MDADLKITIRFIRETCPYYKDLYAHAPDNADFADLPIVDHAAYWKASGQSRRHVMTSPQVDGVVMKTGGTGKRTSSRSVLGPVMLTLSAGTTSRPKTTAYSQIELQRTASLLASGLLAAGVRAGDRVANMFYAGDLYGSFLLHVLSIMALPVPVVHLPIGGLTSVADAVTLVDQCDATVLLTTATSLVKMAMHITATAEPNEVVRRVLFGGEPLFPEQIRLIRAAFPRATVNSCIYGTIDAGVLAMAAPGEDTRVHQAFKEAVIIEILRNDETHQVVTENGEAGVLVATNTVRQLCPVIRYPTGDKAAWVDREKGIFRLLGRASQAVRLGPVSLDMADIRSSVTLCLPSASVQGVQGVLSRHDGLDQLECAVATQAAVRSVDAEAIKAMIYQQRPMLKQHIDLGLVAPVTVRFVGLEELQLTKGSHKLMEIVERRFD